MLHCTVCTPSTWNRQHSSVIKCNFSTLFKQRQGCTQESGLKGNFFGRGKSNLFFATIPPGYKNLPKICKISHIIANFSYFPLFLPFPLNPPPLFTPIHQSKPFEKKTLIAKKIFHLQTVLFGGREAVPVIQFVRF
mgnify:CR=1 FL=1